MDFLKSTHTLAIDSGIKMMPPPERIMTAVYLAFALGFPLEWRSYRDKLLCLFRCKLTSV